MTDDLPGRDAVPSEDPGAPSGRLNRARIFCIRAALDHDPKASRHVRTGRGSGVRFLSGVDPAFGPP